VCDVGILSRSAARAALAKQVPKLIELYFDRFEAIAIFRRERVRFAVFEQVMFFSNEPFNVSANLCVVHAGFLRRNFVTVESLRA